MFPSMARAILKCVFKIHFTAGCCRHVFVAAALANWSSRALFQFRNDEILLPLLPLASAHIYIHSPQS
jgi:hypothetical protein